MDINPIHYIRIKGTHHVLHPEGRVLAVTASEAQAISDPTAFVLRDSAHDMVAKGGAEWVGLAPGSAPPPETHQERHDRHLTEHADMLAQHASEHRALMERHAAEMTAALGLSAAITGL
jgi:hypothetical protein